MKRLTRLSITVGLCLTLCAATYAGDMETTKAPQSGPTPPAAVSTDGDMETTATTADVPGLLAETVVSVMQALSSLF